MYIDTTNAAAGRIVLNAEKADKDAYGREIHRFYESMVPQGTTIPSNTNLNTINFLQVGNYYCSQDATVKTLTNCPTDQAFMMRVYSPLSTTVDNEATSTYVYRLRKIITYKGQEYYQAVNSGSSASTFTYGPWYSELNSQGKLTLSGDLSGSVDLSNNMTLTADITASGVTAGKYGPTANSTPAHGASFKVPEFTVAADGRITAATTRTITLPADNNTTYGLSAESGHIIQLKDNNNGVTKVTLVQGNDMVLTTDTANDKITIAHEAFTTTKASKNTTATPAHGGTFDVLDSVTTDNGHVTGYTVKTVTLPVDNNTTYTISAKNNIITLDGSTGTDTTVTLAAGNDINVSTGTSDNKITIKHQDFTTTPTTSSATDKSPAHGGSFSVIDGITTDNGHITGYTTKSVKLPVDNNTTSSLSAEYNSTDKKHQIRLTESSGTTYNVELAPGNDITLTTDTTNDKITITHAAFTTTGTTSNATDKTPAHGGSFSVIDGITTDNGHVTGYTTKSIKLPADNNTTYTLDLDSNAKVTLNASTGTDTNLTFAAGNDIVVTPNTTDKKITIKHQDFITTKNSTNATASPAHGGTVEVLGSITVDNGHITGYQNKTITLPADNNTTSSLSAEYNTTDKKHQIRLTESTGTTYNVELIPGNDITMATDTAKDTITITHGAFTTTPATSSATDKSPAAGGSFSVVDGITTDNGHITGYTTKSIKLPADNNTTYALSVDANKKVTLTGSNGAVTGVTFNNGKNIGITQSGDNLTVAHDTFTTTEGTKTTAAPAHGATFDVLDSITTSNGHVTGFVKKTVTLPADNNTDTKVTQTAKSDNVNYPLLGAYQASPTSGAAAGTVYDTGMHMNPSTNTITATTFAGNLSGTATKATQDGNGNIITSTYLPLVGGTMSGALNMNGNIIWGLPNAPGGYDHAISYRYLLDSLAGYLPLAGGTMTGGLIAQAGITLTGADLTLGCYSGNSTENDSADIVYQYSNATEKCRIWTQNEYTSYRGPEWRVYKEDGTALGNGHLWASGESITGAVWNDYAECRESDCYEAGYVLSENGDDTLSKTNERLVPFAGVSSDTWGFSQGETDKAKTHIAVAGRVLVHPFQDRNNYKPGDCVCAAPGGTVDIMTREEVREWPDRIVGTVSCVPEYEEWGGGKNADRDPVKVNGRIWIKVK